MFLLVQEKCEKNNNCHHCFDFSPQLHSNASITNLSNEYQLTRIVILVYLIGNNILVSSFSPLQFRPLFIQEVGSVRHCYGIIKSTGLCLFLLQFPSLIQQISFPSGRSQAPTSRRGCNCPAVGRQRDWNGITSTAAGKNLRDVRDGAKDSVSLFAHLHQYRHLFSPLTRRRFFTGT